MSKRTIYIAIFIISVGGLAIVQYKYLQIGLNLAQVQFNRHIGEAGNLIKNDLSTSNQLTFLVGKALQRDSTYFKLGIDSVQDASRFFLNDFITERLIRSGIETDFSYQLFSKDTTYYLQSLKVFRTDEKIATYPILLQGYLPELLDDRMILELKFRDLNSYFLFQLNGLILPSLLFIVGIIVVIIWILRTYYWQRNLIFHTNEFINNLTHELKTPVFSIRLANKILEDTANANQKPVVKIIGQQVNRLTEHIDRVLELANIEAPRKVFDLNKVNFKPYMERLCEDFATLVALEDVVFTYELEDADYWIEAEVFHLENAINNLLDNAKKYAENPVITVKTRLSIKFLHIEITDNGRGISEQYVKKVFQKYYRVDQGDLHLVKGYGLGLSYAKKVVDGMKGKILIFSELDKGTKVKIEIPLKMSELNVKILLVEDDTSLGYLLNEYLQLKGFAVNWAPNGKKALEKLKSERYDLAILDVMMPEMDGFELASNLKKDYPELKFIFLTAKSLKVDVLKGFALGAIDYLKKPIDEEELVVLIKAMLTRFGKSASLQDGVSKGLYHIGSYLFISTNQELEHKGSSVHLSSRENELLRFLVQRRNQLCSHKDILQELWGRNDYFNKKSLNVFITHLRKYLADDDSIRIENVHGQGFILRIPSDIR